MIFRGVLYSVLFGLSLLYAGEIYVFAPTLIKSNVIEKEMAVHIKSHTLRAFGRYSDFKSMVESQRPIAVLAPLATLRELGFLEKVRLQGTVDGSSVQPLVLLSLDKPIVLNEIGAASVGLVSIMDRPALKKYLERQLPAKPKPNPTTKVEDLLPLLTFQSAMAILVTDTQAKQIRARSQANLVAQALPGAVQECLAVALLDNSAYSVIQDLEKLPKTVLELLDLEGWKK